MRFFFPALLAVLVTTTACGNTNDTTPLAGAGGASSTATASSAGGSGGSGGSAPASPFAAPCGDFWTARCTEWQSCLPLTFSTIFTSVAECASSNTTLCADSWSGPNIKASVDEVKACYSAYGTLACPDFIRFLYDNSAYPTPAASACAAVPAGSLADEAVCNSLNECSGRVCQRSPGAYCGVCTSPAAANALCFVNGDCQPEFDCTNGICVPYGELGKACDNNTPCHSDLGCIEGVCSPLVADGGTCNQNYYSCSIDGRYCSESNKCVVEPIALAGAACGYSASGAFTDCAASARCQITDQIAYAGTCVAVAKLGDACTFVDGPDFGQCDVGTTCIQGTCQVVTQAQCDDPTQIPPGGAFKTGMHVALPKVPDSGGPVLSNPQLITITFAGYQYTSDVEAFGDFVVGSQWLKTVGKDYGVGAGTHFMKVEINGPPPGAGGAVNDAGIQAWLAQQITMGTLPTPPDPLKNQYIYMMYFPSTSSITLGNDKSCTSIDGYHSQITGAVQAAYAVIADCAEGIGGITVTASHELIEAATDPASTNMTPTYVIDTVNSPFAFAGGEVADLCNDASIYIGGFDLQRIWSNTAAAAGGDPCVPSIPNTDYFGVTATPSAVQQASAGKTYTYAIQGWSTAPMDDWELYLDASQSDFQPVMKLDKQIINNGETATLTVMIPQGQNGQVIINVSSGMNDYTALQSWPIALVVF